MTLPIELTETYLLSHYILFPMTHFFFFVKKSHVFQIYSINNHVLTAITLPIQ